MKLKTIKYKSILSVSILASLGIGTMMINSYGSIESNAKDPLAEGPVHQIEFGRKHAAAIDSNGDPLMWGKNSNGQLGNGENGTTMISIEPIHITQQVANAGTVISDTSDRTEDTFISTTIMISDQFTFIYDSFTSDVSSTEETLNYTLDLGEYAGVSLISSITVQYRNSEDGSPWIPVDNFVDDSNNTIYLGLLNKGTDYNYEIQVIHTDDTLGETTILSSTSIDFTTEKTEPKVDESVEVTDITSSSATLNYNVTDDGGHSPETTNVQYRSSKDEGEWSDWTGESDFSQGYNEIKLTGLSRETSYVYQVRIFDILNEETLTTFEYECFTTTYSLNSGEIAGIVIGSIAGVALIGAAIWIRIKFIHYIVKKSIKKNHN